MSSMTGSTADHGQVFSGAFMNVDPGEIANDLREKGYFAHPAALSEGALTSIENDATRIRLSLNRNSIGGVYDEKQYFLTHMLAVSKAFYDFCTHPSVFAICTQHLGDEFRLKALRYYETYGGHHMQWHTDNKTDREFADIPGVIFIVYVSDVEDGEFQYVEGSHRWSGQTAYSDYSDQFVEQNHSAKVRSFRMPRGSIVIYNTYGIHRAKPVLDKNFVRKSLFFQVDSQIDRSEPIIVNTEFITDTSPQLAMYLGFGKPAGYDVFPNTTLSSLQMGFAMRDWTMWAIYRLLKPVYVRVPMSWRSPMKSLLVRVGSFRR